MFLELPKLLLNAAIAEADQKFQDRLKPNAANMQKRELKRAGAEMAESQRVVEFGLSVEALRIDRKQQEREAT